MIRNAILYDHIMDILKLVRPLTQYTDCHSIHRKIPFKLIYTVAKRHFVADCSTEFQLILINISLHNSVKNSFFCVIIIHASKPQKCKKVLDCGSIFINKEPLARNY